MLARCVFAIDADGRSGVTLTYPIKGHPWRRNPSRSYIFDLAQETKDLLFEEVYRIQREFPWECVGYDHLYNDMSEKVNGILRDRRTHTSCHLIQTFTQTHAVEVQYALRESSPALVDSVLYKTISELIAPYEIL